MSLRVRMLLFLAVLLVDAALIHDPLPAMALGVAAYLVLVFPQLPGQRPPTDRPSHSACVSDSVSDSEPEEGMKTERSWWGPH